MTFMFCGRGVRPCAWWSGCLASRLKLLASTPDKKASTPAFRAPSSGQTVPTTALFASASREKERTSGLPRPNGEPKSLARRVRSPGAGTFWSDQYCPGKAHAEISKRLI